MSTGKLLQSIGEQIRSRRIDAGITQRVLGERAGIVGKYVSEIERGKRDVPLSTLLAIVERGLRMEVDVVFRHPQGAPSDEVARLVAELPLEQQKRIVTVVREIVELAR